MCTDAIYPRSRERVAGGLKYLSQSSHGPNLWTRHWKQAIKSGSKRELAAGLGQQSRRIVGFFAALPAKVECRHQFKGLHIYLTLRYGRCTPSRWRRSLLVSCFFAVVVANILPLPRNLVQSGSNYDECFVCRMSSREELPSPQSCSQDRLAVNERLGHCRQDESVACDWPVVFFVLVAAFVCSSYTNSQEVAGLAGKKCLHFPMGDG